MADDADMRNELSDMQQRADQLADEVRDSVHVHHFDSFTNTVYFNVVVVFCFFFITGTIKKKKHKKEKWPRADWVHTLRRHI